MGTVKTVILIACLLGVVSTMLDISAPEGSMKKQLSAVAGIVTLLAVFTPFTAEGFKLSFDELETGSGTAYYSDDLDDDLESMMLGSAEKQYEEYFYNKLNKNGIKVSRVSVRLILNDSGEAEIASLKVSIYDQTQTDTALDLIGEDLPDIKAEVVSEDNNEDR